MRPVGKDLLGELNPDDVITYLGKHSQALLLYMEHLVLERRIQVFETLNMQMFLTKVWYL